MIINIRLLLLKKEGKVNSRGEESDDLSGAETSITKTLQNTVDGVERLWNKQIGCGLSSLRTTEEEIETRSTRAVGKANGASKLNQVSSGHRVIGQEWRQKIDSVIDTSVSS